MNKILLLVIPLALLFNSISAKGDKVITSSSSHSYTASKISDKDRKIIKTNHAEIEQLRNQIKANFKNINEILYNIDTKIKNFKNDVLCLVKDNLKKNIISFKSKPLTKREHKDLLIYEKEYKNIKDHVSCKNYN